MNILQKKLWFRQKAQQPQDIDCIVFLPRFTYRKDKKKGFTLLETMVAISILLTSLGAPFTVTQLGLRTARKAGQELVAANLAQEGIEFIRYLRDTNSIKGNTWLTGLDGVGNSPNCVGDQAGEPQTCVVDAIANKVLDVSLLVPPFTCSDVFACPPIKYDDISGLYGYESGDSTIYHRAVHMQVARDFAGEPVEVRVVSEVGWRDLDTLRTIKIEEYIMDWR